MIKKRNFYFFTYLILIYRYINEKTTATFGKQFYNEKSKKNSALTCEASTAALKHPTGRDALPSDTDTMLCKNRLGDYNLVR